MTIHVSTEVLTTGLVIPSGNKQDRQTRGCKDPLSLI